MPEIKREASIPQIVMANAALIRSLFMSLIVSTTTREMAPQILDFLFEEAKQDLVRYDPRGTEGAKKFLDHQRESIMAEVFKNGDGA